MTRYLAKEVIEPSGQEQHNPSLQLTAQAHFQHKVWTSGQEAHNNPFITGTTWTLLLATRASLKQHFRVLILPAPLYASNQVDDKKCPSLHKFQSPLHYIHLLECLRFLCWTKSNNSDTGQMKVSNLWCGSVSHRLWAAGCWLSNCTWVQ